MSSVIVPHLIVVDHRKHHQGAFASLLHAAHAVLDHHTYSCPAFAYSSSQAEACMHGRREIMHDMFRLWCLAEGDLLHDKLGYRLVNTGQGLNRVQQVWLPPLHMQLAALHL